MQSAIAPDAIPGAIRLAITRSESPDLSGLDALEIGHGLKFGFPGVDANGLTKAANNIRNRARRRGRSLGMQFSVHFFGADSVYLVRTA